MKKSLQIQTIIRHFLFKNNLEIIRSQFYQNTENRLFSFSFKYEDTGFQLDVVISKENEEDAELNNGYFTLKKIGTPINHFGQKSEMAQYVFSDKQSFSKSFLKQMNKEKIKGVFISN